MKNMLPAVALVAGMNTSLASANEQRTVIELQSIPLMCSLYMDKTSKAIMACLNKNQLFQGVEVLGTATIVSTGEGSKIAYDNVISLLTQDPNGAKKSGLKQPTPGTIVWDIDGDGIKDITFTEERTTAHDFAYGELDARELRSTVTRDEFTGVIYDQTGENIPKKGLEEHNCAIISIETTIKAEDTNEITISAPKGKVCTPKTIES